MINRFTLTGMLLKNNVDIIDIGHAKDDVKLEENLKSNKRIRSCDINWRSFRR